MEQIVYWIVFIVVFCLAYLIWFSINQRRDKVKDTAYKKWEAEREINHLRHEDQRVKRELSRLRTNQEWQKVYNMAETCRNFVSHLTDEFQSDPEWDKAWVEWMLDEGISSYLPLCVGEILKKMEEEGKYAPIQYII